MVEGEAPRFPPSSLSLAACLLLLLLLLIFFSFAARILVRLNMFELGGEGFPELRLKLRKIGANDLWLSSAVPSTRPQVPLARSTAARKFALILDLTCASDVYPLFVTGNLGMGEGSSEEDRV